MEATELKMAIEAVLFAYGEPIPATKLAEILEEDRSAVRRAIDAMEYDFELRGLKLIWLEDCVQLCTDERFDKYVRAALDNRRNTPLSQAAMEVLAIAAYHQPVTKGYIEQVRGVDCGAVVNNLVEKDLLCECGRLDLPGHPILYKTTKNFLRCFDLSSLEELPQIFGEQPTDEIKDEMQMLFEEE